MFDLAKRLGLRDGALVVADVGAAEFVGEHELHRSLPTRLATRYCFDASDRVRAQLKESEGTIILPYALGDGTSGTLHSVEGGMTSLLEPDLEQWSLFTLFERPQFNVVRTSAISTRRMDDVAELPNIDFLKLDVQGSELAILENGMTKLAQCSVIQIEVSFLPLYRNQPLFADIDQELRRQGFMVHGFASMKRLPIAPYRLRGDTGGINQLIDLDMIYVRNIVRPTTMSDDQLRKTSVIADACYGSFDLVNRCLIELHQRGACENNLLDDYIANIRAQNRRVAIHHFPAHQT